jgi:hypothetical protein
MKKLIIAILLITGTLNLYAANNSLGVKGGMGIGFSGSHFLADGNKYSTLQLFGLNSGVEIFGSIGFSKFLALQMQLGYNYNYFENARILMDSQYGTAGRTNITTQSFFFEFGPKFNLAIFYLMPGLSLGYTKIDVGSFDMTPIATGTLTRVGASQNGSFSFGGFLESGVEIPIGPGDLILAGKIKAVRLYNLTNTADGDWISFRVGYAFNF